MQRRKRFSPDRSRTSFNNTAFKEEVLELLAQYKYLRSHSIRSLLPHRSPAGLGRSLRTLFDEGLIDKPKEARRGYNNLYSPDIYMLAPKGEQYLLERGRSPKTITRLYRQLTDGPIKNFGHAMMVCDTLASLHAGTIGTGVVFIPWTEIVAKCTEPKPLKLPFLAEWKGQVLPSFVVPDGLFGLAYPNGQVSYFAVECEHFNPIEPKDLNRASFLKKMLAYRDIQKTNVFQRQLRIPNMRVLVVAPTKQRVQHMIELTERVAKQSNLFLFHDVPVQEELLKAPPPFPELLTAEWRRAGLDDAYLYKKETPAP